MSVPLLLDTHIVLWVRLDPDRLSAEERAAIVGAPRRLISIASLWEIAILMTLRRVPLDPRLVAEVPDGFETLEIGPQHARELVSLPSLHRDPFGRMLIAQAKCDQLALLTRDRQIARYAGEGVTVLAL